MSPRAASPAEWLRPSVHPVYARLLCAEMRRRGWSPEVQMQGTGLDWNALHSGQAFLSLAQLQRLVSRALELSQDPALGLAVGLSTELASHGALGFAALSAPRLGGALALLPRYSGLRLQLAAFALEIGTETAVLRLDERLDDPSLRAYVLGHITGALLRLLQSVTGQDSGPLIALHWPLPRGPGADALLAAAPEVHWSATGWRMEFAATLLQAPTLAPDAQAHREALRSCDEHLARGPDGGLTQRLRLHLLACDSDFPNVQQMAAIEGLSARSLIRHLRDEGTRYQTLLDQTRADLACWLLAQTEQSVERIAARLGFADPSNFSRSFRRWCGTTPRAFRQSAR